MNVRNSLMLMALFAGAAAFTTDASAKSTSDSSTVTPIETTGIKPFDEVFVKAQDIQTNLVTSKEKLKKANDDVASSLGLAAGTPFKDAMADLKTKANGKVKVAMTGKTPTLTAEEGVPANVKAAVDSTNKAIGEISSVVDSLAQVPDQAQALATQTAAFPGQVNADMIKSSGLKITDLPKVTKTVKSNVTAVGQTPDQAKAVSAEGVGMLNTVTSTFQ